jgi:hypothetical protein
MMGRCEEFKEKETQHDTKGRAESSTHVRSVEEEEPRSLAREKHFNIHFLLSFFFQYYTPNMGDCVCILTVLYFALEKGKRGICLVDAILFSFLLFP